MKILSVRAPTVQGKQRTEANAAHQASGKVHIKFFLWPSIIISIVLSVIGTILLNIIL